MRKLILLIVLLMLSGCSIIRPVNNPSTQINIKDSTIINIKDSTVIIPVEKVINVVAYPDTLHLETSLAKAKAYVDTSTNNLKGEMENKKGYTQKTRIEYRDRIIRDTTKIEIPVDRVVEKIVKPKNYNFLLWYFVSSLLILGLTLFFKIKKI